MSREVDVSDPEDVEFNPASEEGRKTFRKKVNGKAWQRIMRERAEERYEGKEWWSRANVSLDNCRVRETSRKIARKIILEYEWLGTLPPGASRFYGIFFDDWACGGVTCFGVGANVYAHDELGIERDELSYLVRGACTHWTPKNTNSKLISYSLDFEKEKGKKVAIAYADTEAGEIGQLYQATNWLCLGKGDSVLELIHPETGRIYNQKEIADTIERNNLEDQVSWAEMRDYFIEEGWELQESNPKYKYIYILAEGEEHDRIYSNIEDKIEDYPKRE